MKKNGANPRYDPIIVEFIGRFMVFMLFVVLGLISFDYGQSFIGCIFLLLTLTAFTADGV